MTQSEPSQINKLTLLDFTFDPADRARYTNSQFDVNIEEYCRETLERSQVKCERRLNVSKLFLDVCSVQVCRVGGSQ